jgi:hypothetical protein
MANRTAGVAVEKNGKLVRILPCTQEPISELVFKWVDGEPHEIRIVDYH